MDPHLVAVVVGLLQGVFEWLPISSEGNIAIALTALGTSPGVAVSYALFVHLGTALSATAYYRDEVRDALASWSSLRLSSAFDGQTATLSFVVLATAASSAVGLVALLALEALVSELTGGAFVALIGGLLVATGVPLNCEDIAVDRHLVLCRLVFDHDDGTVPLPKPRRDRLSERSVPTHHDVIVEIVYLAFAFHLFEFLLYPATEGGRNDRLPDP